MRPFITLWVSASLAVALACSSGDGIAPDGAPGSGNIQTTAGTPNPQASQFFEHLEGQVPAGFPENFPIYAGAEIERGDTLNDRYVIDLRSEDELDVVIDFYRAGLKVSPWLITNEEAGENSVVFTYSDEHGGYSGEVAIGPLQERTWILIAMQRP